MTTTQQQYIRELLHALRKCQREQSSLKSIIYQHETNTKKEQEKSKIQTTSISDDESESEPPPDFDLQSIIDKIQANDVSGKRIPDILNIWATKYPKLNKNLTKQYGSDWQQQVDTEGFTPVNFSKIKIDKREKAINCVVENIAASNWEAANKCFVYAMNYGLTDYNMTDKESKLLNQLRTKNAPKGGHKTKRRKWKRRSQKIDLEIPLFVNATQQPIKLKQSKCRTKFLSPSTRPMRSRRPRSTTLRARLTNC